MSEGFRGAGALKPIAAALGPGRFTATRWSPAQNRQRAKDSGAASTPDARWLLILTIHTPMIRAAMGAPAKRRAYWLRAAAWTTMTPRADRSVLVRGLMALSQRLTLTRTRSPAASDMPLGTGTIRDQRE